MLVILYCCKNDTIFFFSSSVINARVCMCMPMVSHCSCEKDEGEGTLWQRWQFSAHNCAPLLAAIFWLAAQPVINAMPPIIMQAIAATVILDI
jgi:hypothetical protein